MLGGIFGYVLIIISAEVPGIMHGIMLKNCAYSRNQKLSCSRERALCSFPALRVQILILIFSTGAGLEPVYVLPLLYRGRSDHRTPDDLLRLPDGSGEDAVRHARERGDGCFCSTTKGQRYRLSGSDTRNSLRRTRDTRKFVYAEMRTYILAIYALSVVYA